MLTVLLPEVFQCIEGADHAVLMKTMAPVGTAKIGSVDTIDISLALLCGNTVRRKHRVVIAELLDDLVRVNGGTVVECHQEGLLCRQTLQQVHIVRDGYRRVVTAQLMIVPRRPGEAAARQQRGIGVQHHLVALVGNGAEHFAFLCRGILQHGECLVTVSGDKHPVEALRPVTSAADLYMGRVSRNAGYRRVKPDLLAERCGQFIDVTPGAAADDTPLRPVLDIQ